MSVQTTQELPKYRNHQEVRALKIKEVIVHDPAPGIPFAGASLLPEDGRYDPVSVEADWYDKHQPQAGGYYVVQAGGERTYESAKSFEETYASVL